DLAGTTIDDSGGAVLRCLSQTARQYDLPGSDDALNALMGMNKREGFDLLASRRYPNNPGEAEQVSGAALLSCVTAVRPPSAENLKPIAGVEMTFAFLRGRGVSIAIDTGFDETVGSLIMRRLDWLGKQIDTVVFSSDVVRGRPAPYMIFRAMERVNALDVRH